MIKSTKRFVVTDESENFYGFRVRTSGIDWNRFNENPVCTLNHNYEKVLGKWTDFEFDGSKVTAVPEFDENDPEAMLIYQKIEQGIIKTASVGLGPKSRIVNGWLEKSEALEIAIAPVPGNKNAKVKLYNNQGIGLSAEETTSYIQSITVSNSNNNLNMNPNVLAALVALCVQAGQKVQLSADAGDEALVGAINSVGNKITALELSVNQLTSANTAYKAKDDALKAVEKATILNLAVENKQITESQKENFGKLYDADPELCKSTLENLPKVNLSVVVPGAQTAAAAQQATNEKANWSFDDYATKAPLELSAMQAQNPEQFNKLFEDKAKALRATGSIAQ